MIKRSKLLVFLLVSGAVDASLGPVRRAESDRHFSELVAEEHLLLVKAFHETQKELKTVPPGEYRWFLKDHIRGLRALLSIAVNDSHAHLPPHDLRHLLEAQRLSSRESFLPQLGFWISNETIAFTSGRPSIYYTRNPAYIGPQGTDDETDEE